MDNIVYLKGIPTPRYTAQRMKQDQDPDLMVNMVNNNQGHIMRSKAKAEWIRIQRRKELEAEQAREDEREALLNFLGHVSIYSMLALLVVIAL